MTAQKDQIQALIRDVDRVLQQPSPKFAWGTGSHTEQLRQVLKRVRHFLHQSLIKPIPTLNLPPALVSSENAQDVMQSVVQEMQEMRLGVLRPLHNEVSALMQQRTALLREIRQLETQRNEVLEAQTRTQTAPAATETIEQLGLVHDRADQVLTSLDTTLRVVFDALQRDMQAYQDSLSQGLDNLHTLGRQSEVMFSGLVGRLAEQLGRDASSYLRPGEFPDSEDLHSLAEASSSLEGNDAPAVLHREPEPASPKPPARERSIALPYAGTELPPEAAFGRVSPSSSNSIHTLTELIDQVTVSPASFHRQPNDTPVVYSVTPPEQTLGTTPAHITPLEHRPSQSTDRLSSSPPLSPAASPLPAPTPSIPKEAQSIFSLEGLGDDLFVEDDDLFVEDNDLFEDDDLFESDKP
ncbi:hypothetical protein [Myxacorys almedinensis]|uniref:Uncharacterized protein n=1 Tax=Myxacorys almedinensis A TaxID=2690445 RepID=A0A8J7Z645_9CYAN|nr:hypothetical protein [Myxacorys almedinensis]NDJ16170.1 hypothetical protein [Myxacorys almedinensis A]